MIRESSIWQWEAGNIFMSLSWQTMNSPKLDFVSCIRKDSSFRRSTLTTTWTRTMQNTHNSWRECMVETWTQNDRWFIEVWINNKPISHHASVSDEVCGDSVRLIVYSGILVVVSYSAILVVPRSLEVDPTIKSL